MTTGFDEIRDLLLAAVPFAAHTGLEYDELSPGAATVALPDTPQVRNHVGSAHAGALFTAGESASGAAFMTAFAERLAELRPLVTEASITYTALAKGRITASAHLPRPAETMLAEVDARGRTSFAVPVEFHDARGALVATMTVTWLVRSARPT